MNIFENCKDEKEARNLYRRMAQRHHSDKGGDDQAMGALNQQWEEYQHGECSQSAHSDSRKSSHREPERQPQADNEQYRGVSMTENMRRQIEYNALQEILADQKARQYWRDTMNGTHPTRVDHEYFKIHHG